MNGARGTCKKGGDSGRQKRGSQGVKRGWPSNKKAPAKRAKKGGEVFANCNQLRRSCFRQQVVSGTAKRRKSNCSTAAMRQRKRGRDRPARRSRRRVRAYAIPPPVDPSEKSIASFEPVICAVTGETVGLKDLSTESKTPLLSELTPSSDALSPIAAVETAQKRFSAAIYLLPLIFLPLRRYPSPKRPPQLVSPTTQLAERLVAAAAVAQASADTRTYAPVCAHTTALSPMFSPTQPTQTPLTRSVTPPFSLCAEFSPWSTNYSTRHKRRLWGK